MTAFHRVETKGNIYTNTAKSFLTTVVDVQDSQSALWKDWWNVTIHVREQGCTNRKKEPNERYQLPRNWPGCPFIHSLAHSFIHSLIFRLFPTRPLVSWMLLVYLPPILPSSLSPNFTSSGILPIPLYLHLHLTGGSGSYWTALCGV